MIVLSIASWSITRTVVFFHFRLASFIVAAALNSICCHSFRMCKNLLREIEGNCKVLECVQIELQFPSNLKWALAGVGNSWLAWNKQPLQRNVRIVWWMKLWERKEKWATFLLSQLLFKHKAFCNVERVRLKCVHICRLSREKQFNYSVPIIEWH